MARFHHICALIKFLIFPGIDSCVLLRPGILSIPNETENGGRAVRTLGSWYTLGRWAVGPLNRWERNFVVPTAWNNLHEDMSVSHQLQSSKQNL